jgi:4-hydroxybenzoate polyprenyltransferase
VVVSIKSLIKSINKIYRISDWFYYLGFILIGISLSSAITFNLKLLLLLFVGFSLLAYAYSFNNFYDKQEKKKFFLFPLFLFFISLFFLNWFQVSISFIFIFIFTIYSYPPIRLKSKPIFSTFSNSISFSLLFFLGSSFINFNIFFLFLIFVCLNTTAQLFHEIIDYKEDKRRKDITTTVNYGPNFSKNLSISFLLFVAIISAALFYLQVVNIFFFVSSLIFVSYFYFKTKKSKIDKKFRDKYRNFGILVGIIYFLSILINYKLL